MIVTQPAGRFVQSAPSRLHSQRLPSTLVEIPFERRSTYTGASHITENRVLPNTSEPTAIMSADVTNEYTIDPDVQRMLRVRDDDHEAFSELVELYQDRVVGLLTHMTGDNEAAEDLAQEVFLRVYRARVGYEPTARFSTWLFRITQNVAFNSRRNKSRRKEVRFRAENSSSTTSITGEAAVAEKSALMPTRRLDANETQEMVREAVMRLAERQRMALLLHKFEDMSYADIGQAMDLSVSAVKSLLSRARESLRQELEGFVANPRDN